MKNTKLAQLRKHKSIFNYNKPYKASELQKESEIKSKLFLSQEQQRNKWRKEVKKGQKQIKKQKLSAFKHLKNAKFLNINF